MIEEWRPIAGYEGRYSVSNLGRVWTHKRRYVPAGRVLVQWLNPRGYSEVQLWRAGASRCTHVPVHKLVSRAFLGEPPAGMEVRHLNGDRQDPRLSNLAYGTRKENRRDQLLHGTDWNANKTHCPQGHAYDEANTYRTRDGKRMCRACQVAWMRRRKESLTGRPVEVANKAKTHCKRGHEFTPENTVMVRGGRVRACRQCRQRRAREAWRRRQDSLSA